MTQANFAERMTSTVASIISKAHACQQDMGDDDDHEALEEDESSEYDWLVIDTALDVVIGMSKALGDQFGEMWKVYQKLILKYASSQTNYERSTSVGVIAECTRNMDSGVTPYTAQLMKVLMHRLSDEDPETKSNAAYAMGLLIFHSKDTAAYLPSFNQILGKLEPLLQTRRARTLDNACGCVSRMIMAHQDKVPVDDIMPVLVDLLPLTEDYEENTPIFECIAGLCKQNPPTSHTKDELTNIADHHQNSTIIELTPKLIPIFASVLSEPEEQLDDSTRAKVVATVKFIAEKNPALVQGNEKLMAAMRG